MICTIAATTPSPAHRIQALARSRGILRARDLNAAGFHPSAIQRLVQQGYLERLDRGLYIAQDSPLTGQESLAIAALRAPEGVICLLSALAFHGIGTQLPNAVWVALPRTAWRPKVTYPKLEVVRHSGPMYSLGIKKQVIQGVTVRVYSPAKTVVDCFRYRNQIGLDVALEALEDAVAQRLTTVGGLWRLARDCRILSAMKPHLQRMAS